MSALPYRQAAPGDPDPYLTAWAELRDLRRKRALAATVLAGCFAVLLVTCAGGAVHDVMAYVLGMGAMVLCAAVILRGGTSACPHCRTPFAFTNRCAACGIAVGTPRGIREPAESITDERRHAVARDTAIARFALLAAVGVSALPLFCLFQYWPSLVGDVARQLDPYLVYDLGQALPAYALMVSPAVLVATTVSAFVFGCARRIPSNAYAWIMFLLAWSVSFLATICLVAVVSALK